MYQCWLFRILVLIAFHQQLALIAPISAQELRRMRVAVTSPGMTNLNLYVANRAAFSKNNQIFKEIIVMRFGGAADSSFGRRSIELRAGS